MRFADQIPYVGIGMILMKKSIYLCLQIHRLGGVEINWRDEVLGSTLSVPELGHRKPPPLKRSHSIGGASIKRPMTTNFSDTSEAPGSSLKLGVFFRFIWGLSYSQTGRFKGASQKPGIWWPRFYPGSGNHFIFFKATLHRWKTTQRDATASSWRETPSRSSSKG